VALLTPAVERPTVLGTVIDREGFATAAPVDGLGTARECPARVADAPGDGGLLGRLRGHVPADEKETRDLAEILRFLSHHPDPFDRRNPGGHLTGSAIVVSATGDRVLLLHHRKLRRWLQPGGHAEPGERDGAVVALREAQEETGIAGLALHPSAPRPLDVDVHPIPARGPEPAHRHLDLRYLVVAPPTASLRRRAAEARALRWFRWEDLATLDLDPGLRRALRSARALMGGTPVPAEEDYPR
jgi:8-oxo-dGTP pyrophosphatase MutT (NUDIX family)